MRFRKSYDDNGRPNIDFEGTSEQLLVLREIKETEKELADTKENLVIFQRSYDFEKNRAEDLVKDNELLKTHIGCLSEAIEKLTKEQGQLLKDVENQKDFTAAYEKSFKYYKQKAEEYLAASRDKDEQTNELSKEIESDRRTLQSYKTVIEGFEKEVKYYLSLLDSKDRALEDKDEKIKDLEETVKALRHHSQPTPLDLDW